MRIHADPDPDPKPCSYRKQIAALEEELQDLKSVELSNMSDDTERKIKTLVREWERRIAIVEAQREQATSILIKGLMLRDEKSR
jgi:hypothetical protein